MKHRCREVTRLVLEGEDRELSLLERGQVRLHLLVCQACPRFVAQVALMREAMRRWRSGDPGDGRPPA